MGALVGQGEEAGAITQKRAAARWSGHPLYLLCSCACFYLHKNANTSGKRNRLQSKNTKEKKWGGNPTEHLPKGAGCWGGTEGGRVPSAQGGRGGCSPPALSQPRGGGRWEIWANGFMLLFFFFHISSVILPCSGRGDMRREEGACYWCLEGARVGQNMPQMIDLWDCTHV